MVRDWGAARRAVLQYLAVLAGCCAVGTAALVWLGPRAGALYPNFPRWPFIDMWVRWDAGWYQAIALTGYYFAPGQQSPVAYFPLYPGLMHLGVLAGANVFLAGIAITVACGLAAFVLFRWWSGELTDAPTGERASWLLALWPFAFYLYGAVYSDALFLALVTGAFLCLERKSPLWATVLGALATATRPVAPAVVAGLLVRQLELRRRAGLPIRAVDFAPLLSGAGALAYMVFLYVRFGEPLAFLKAQVGWAQAPGWGWLGKFAVVGGALFSVHPEDALLPLFNGALAIAFCVLAFSLPKRLGWGYAVYTGLVLGLPLLASRDFIGLGRYCLAAFPCFLLAADKLRGRPRATRAWLVVAPLLLALMVGKFAMGRYVS